MQHRQVTRCMCGFMFSWNAVSKETYNLYIFHQYVLGFKTTTVVFLTLGSRNFKIALTFLNLCPIHKNGFISYRTYLSCLSMTRLKRRLSVCIRKQRSPGTPAKRPGHKVGFHREWLNMRHVVLGPRSSSHVFIHHCVTNQHRKLRAVVDGVQFTQHRKREREGKRSEKRDIGGCMISSLWGQEVNRSASFPWRFEL